MRRLKAMLLVLICLTIGIPATLSQENRIPVSVIVSAKDPSTKSLIESHIKRNLRGLGDVNVNTYPGYTIHIVAIKIKNIGGNHTGYSIATAITSSSSVSLYDGFTDEMKKIIIPAEAKKKLLEPIEEFENLNLSIGNDLKSMCEEIVADFDTEHLESARESLSAVKRILQKIRD